MKRFYSLIFIIAFLFGVLPTLSGVDAPFTVLAQQAGSKSKKNNTTSAKKNVSGVNAKKGMSSSKNSSSTANKASGKSATKNKASGKSATKKKTSSAPAKKATANSQPKTSAEAKKRQEDTQREIRLTEQQIKENEKNIKSGLNELGKLESDIAASRKVIAAAQGSISKLTTQISSLEEGIAVNEKELTRLRDEYLKAVKKMRVSRMGNSDLAFVFASDNFNQALRRMRYLKQFSQWKDRQSEAIAGKTKQLREQKEQLAEARLRQDEALKQQKAQEAKLVEQHTRQDAIVAGLRKNGDALNAHLSRKQAEANQLRNQIAQLIIAEERKAAEERERKAAEEKARIAREEQARKAKEEQARIAREAKAEEDSKNKELLAESKDKGKATKNKEEKKSSNKGDKKVSAKEKSDKGYADARKRQRRSKGDDKSSGKDLAVASKVENGNTRSASNSPKSVTGGNFAAMKGSLPKPASGSFRVTSRFGRQSLPDLPDVVYDNPGIDAEVSAGASALAVYSGRVSGVYMLAGYNTVVIVNHGSYYTVYGNIASPAVKVGDEVRAGQGLGSVAADEDDRSRGSIHFEVWKSREKLNPLDWIRL